MHSTPPPEGLKVSAGGWYHFFHIEDIRAIAHRWLYYCEQMRLNPQKYWRVEGKDGKGGVGVGGAKSEIPTPNPDPEPITRTLPHNFDPDSSRRPEREPNPEPPQGPT